MSTWMHCDFCNHSYWEHDYEGCGVPGCDCIAFDDMEQK